MISLAPSRATSSRTSARSRPEPNNASISARIFSVGDTRDGTGVVLPVQTLAVLYGTYARRHLHRWMDTAVRDGESNCVTDGSETAGARPPPRPPLTGTVVVASG